MQERILTPESAAYVADRALELERAVELAVRVGADVEALARRIESLKRERAELGRRLHAARPVDRPALRARIEALVADLRRALVGAPAAMRKAFEVLLRDGRIRVLPDAERGYRVGGVFVLSPKQLRRTPEDAAQQVLVAGARFVPEPALRLAVAWPLAV